MTIHTLIQELQALAEAYGADLPVLVGADGCAFPIALFFLDNAGGSGPVRWIEVWTDVPLQPGVTLDA